VPLHNKQGKNTAVPILTHIRLGRVWVKMVSRDLFFSVMFRFNIPAQAEQTPPALSHPPLAKPKVGKNYKSPSMQSSNVLRLWTG